MLKWLIQWNVQPSGVIICDKIIKDTTLSAKLKGKVKSSASGVTCCWWRHVLSLTDLGGRLLLVVFAAVVVVRWRVLASRRRHVLGLLHRLQRLLFLADLLPDNQSISQTINQTINRSKIKSINHQNLSIEIPNSKYQLKNTTNQIILNQLKQLIYIQ